MKLGATKPEPNSLTAQTRTPIARIINKTVITDIIFLYKPFGFFLRGILFL